MKFWIKKFHEISWNFSKILIENIQKTLSMNFHCNSMFLLCSKILKNIQMWKKFILENSRNSLSKSTKKAGSIWLIFFMIILHNFHEFSRSKNQPGIRKKNTRKFLLGFTVSLTVTVTVNFKLYISFTIIKLNLYQKSFVRFYLNFCFLLNSKIKKELNRMKNDQRIFSH